MRGLKRMRDLRVCRAGAVAWILAVAAAYSPAHAATAVFTNTNPGADYEAPANWSTGNIPGNGNNDLASIGDGVVRSAAYTGSASYTTSGRLIVGNNAGGNGTLTLSGTGTLTFAADGYANSVDIGQNGGTGSLTLNSGALTLTSGALPGSIRLGVNGTANGTLTVNGGILTVPGRILMGANNASAVATLNLNGGEINLGAGLGGSGDPGRGRLWMGTGNATANLNGGTLTLYDFMGSGGANTRVYFNGTTVKPVTNNAAFIASGLVPLLVRTNGAIFDTAGWSITIAQGLAHDGGMGATPDGGLVKNGAGTLTLTANSTYTGGTTVNGGTLALSGGGSLYNNGTAAGTVAVNSNGVLYFGRNDPFGGHTANVQPTLLVRQGGVVSNGATYTTLGNITLEGGRMESGGGAGVFGFQSFGLTKTVTATGDVTSTIAQGAGTSGSAYLLNNPTFLVRDGAAAVDLDVPATLVNYRGASPTFPEIATGFVKDGAGVMRLGSTANSYGGLTTITNGTLRLGASGVLPDGPGKGDVALGPAGTLDLGGYSEGINGLSGNGTVDNTLGGGSYVLTVGNDDDTTTFGGVIRNTSGTVALTKNGTGTLTLTGANLYGGETVVNAGRLAIAGSGRPGALNAAQVVVKGGAILDFQRHDTFGIHLADVQKVLVVEAGGLITNGNTYTTLGHVILAGGRIHSGGGATPAFQAFGFTKTITATGDVTSVIAQGVAANSAFLISNATFQVYDGAAAVDLDVSATLVNYYSGAYVEIPTGLTKTGPGVMQLGGNNTYDGLTLIQDGTLLIDGNMSGALGGVTVQIGGTLGGTGTVGGALDVQAGGRLAPGNSIGSLTLGSAVTLDGTYALEVGAGTDVDFFQTAGTLTLGASSVLDVVSGTLTAGNTYVIARYQAGGLTGTFGDITDVSAQGFMVLYDQSGRTEIWLAEVPEPGTLGLLAVAAVAAAFRRRAARR